MRVRAPFLTGRSGTTAVETAFLMPVVLIGLMMLFEIVRLALVILLGTLALESALQSLRTLPDLSLRDDEAVADLLQDGMVAAAHGYLEAENIQVQVTSYADLAAFGSTAGNDEETEEDEDSEDGTEDQASNDPPVLSVEVSLSQEWSTALPELLGLANSFTYTCQQVLGSLPQAHVGVESDT